MMFYITWSVSSTKPKNVPSFLYGILSAERQPQALLIGKSKRGNS
jgi:hypothetical protein